jgi:hypothetical protein
MRAELERRYPDHWADSPVGPSLPKGLPRWKKILYGVMKIPEGISSGTKPFVPPNP